MFDRFKLFYSQGAGGYLLRHRGVLLIALQECYIQYKQ